MRFYIDTCIWIDFVEDRGGFNENPIGEYAYKLLNLIKSRKDTIVLSDVVLIELGVKYSVSEINGIFKNFEHIIEKIFTTKEQNAQARVISIERNVPKGDALNAIIAHDTDSILVTRDKHFILLEDISKNYTPEELI